MHIAALASTLLFATGALGLRTVSKASQDSEVWTIEGLSRQCSDDESECVWRFSVFRTVAASSSRTACEHALEALPDGTPASRIRGSGATLCVAPPSDSEEEREGEGLGHGPFNYTVTSGWSDEFGDSPDKAFTTLSLIDYDEGLISYPSYTDAQVRDGKPVEPDSSFPVRPIPSNVE